MAGIIGQIEGRTMVDAQAAVGKTIAAVYDGKAVLIAFTDGTVATIESGGDEDCPTVDWTPSGWSPPSLLPHELHAAGLIDHATMLDRERRAYVEGNAARAKALRAELAILEARDGG